MSDLDTQLPTMEYTIDSNVINTNESLENVNNASVITQEDCNNLTNDMTIMNTSITDTKIINENSNKGTSMNVISETSDTQDDINMKSQNKAFTSPTENYVKNNQEDLDNTLISTQDDTNLIQKTNLFIDDYNNHMFITDFFPDKRSGKMRNLREEYFDFDIYQNNQCGFKTCRPFDWIQALENYVTKNEDIKCRWDYKKNSEGEYDTCVLIIYFENIKQIKILLYLKTGILMVKVQLYKVFITKEFTKIANEIVSIPPVANPLYNEPDETEPPCTSDIDDGDKNELETEISLAWEDIAANKKAISIIERNIEFLTQNSQNASKEEHEGVRKYNEQIFNLEKRYDSKLVVFMATYKEQYEKALTDLQEKFNKKFDSMQDIIGKFKINTQEQLNQYTKEKDEWKKVYDEWLQKTVEKDNTTPEKNIQELEKAIEFHASEVNELKQECKVALQKLSEVARNIYNNRDNKEANHRKENPLITGNIANHNETTDMNLETRTQPTTTTETELLICMDSNRRYIDYRKLWTLKGSRRKPCGNLYELNETIKNEKTTLGNIVY